MRVGSFFARHGLTSLVGAALVAAAAAPAAARQ